MKKLKRAPRNSFLSCFVFVLLVFCGCKKFISIGPPDTQLVTASVFNSDAAATAAVTGIYGNMYGSPGFAGELNFSTTLLCGLSADELENFSTDPAQTEFYKNALSSSNGTVYDYLWGQAYQDIYDANAVIEGLSGSSSVSAEVKTELTGEAKFIRAFCYFYLVNFFGDVPLLTSINYQSNAVAGRTAQAKVFDQITTDLIDAQNALPVDYLFAGGERIRPNRWAATALLARVYLYIKDWKDAEDQASAVINNPTLYSLPLDMDSVFLANSPEAIWQFQPVKPGVNTTEGNIFILTTTPNVVALSQEVLQSFEPGDLRRTNWVDSIIVGSNVFYYPYKYKVKTGNVLTEYSMVFRLAEQYLIRSEARSEEGNILGAQSDLNTIRARAGLDSTTAATQADLLTAILHERQVELFTEWGHRWFDLKRTANINMIMQEVTPEKGGSWNSDGQLYPVPQSDILLDPSLSQNPGY